MASLINVGLSTILFLLFLISCKQKDTSTEPSPTVDGIYQATLYRTDANGYGGPSNAITTVVVPYPINAHSLTMNIESITDDSVRVTIQPNTPASVPDGIFSPTQPLSFPKAYIKAEYTEDNQKRYFIYLDTNQPLSELKDGISIYENGRIADYFFDLSAIAKPTVPPLPKARVVIKFEKLY